MTLDLAKISQDTNNKRKKIAKSDFIKITIFRLIDLENFLVAGGKEYLGSLGRSCTHSYVQNG